MVEDVQHGPVQRLGAVQHGQDRAGDVQAPLPQPDDQGTNQGGVLVGPSSMAIGAVAPRIVNPRAPPQTCSPKCTPSTMNATRSRLDRSRLDSSALIRSVKAASV